MGFLEFAVNVEISGLDTFSKCKSQESVYHVRYAWLLKMTSSKHVSTGFTQMTIREAAIVV